MKPDPGVMVRALCRGATRGYGKMFLKAPLAGKGALEDAGMIEEATITGYFSGEPADVMSLYLDDERMQRPFEAEQERDTRDDPVTPPPTRRSRNCRTATDHRRARSGDTQELAELYATVFASYPFPITDPDLLDSTMKTHVVYRIVRDAGGALVAAASAETCRRYRNAEMTDFATLPASGGSDSLSIFSQPSRRHRGWAIPNLYTVARARSAGMNRVFYNRGYEMTGTLVNNCHISGRFEDMHVWCRRVG